jgi:glucose-6-phosphate isomerase
MVQMKWNHFKTADFDQNMPVVLALLSIWYNFFELKAKL